MLLSPDPSKFGAPCPCGRKAYSENTGLGKVKHILYAKDREPRYACGPCAEEAPLATLIRPVRPNEPSTTVKRRMPKRPV
jgi:hypothetical protein